MREMLAEFVHLRLHSEYSVNDSIIRIGPGQKQSLIDAVKKAGHRAVALCDEMNFFGLVQFYQAAREHQIKPIVGADVRVRTPYGVVVVPLFVMNGNGYKQLCHILTKAWCSSVPKGEQAVIDFTDLANNCSDLIALCGGLNGAVAQPALSAFNSINEVIQPWLDVFKGRFYLEIQRLGFVNEESWIERAIELSQRHQLPLVATNHVRFITTSDYSTHEMRVCINRSLSVGSDEIQALYSHYQYYRSTEEMVELFNDLPVAIANTYAVAQRCNFDMQLGSVSLPLFDIPEKISLQDYFKQQSHQGLVSRLQELDIAKEQQKPYYERLEKELKIITEMDYIGYFLIIADFIQWAKDNDIPVGPGRGSGAGSLVAFCLSITDVDPMKYGLIFERFLNPERKSMPDVDIDFCMDGRDDVIQYVVDKYGVAQVSQIVTFGRLAARSVVRDVARVQGLPYAVGDRIAKLIPKGLDMTLEKALEESTELKLAVETDEEMWDIFNSSLDIEGLVRNVGKHAAGIVIAPTNLENFCPLYRDEDSAANVSVTHFDKDDIEKVGLVKFDFLGLRTLTVIKWAVEWANELLDKSEVTVDISQISYDDPAVFALLSKGMTDGVFQLESPGVKRYIKELKPTCLEDIVAMVALYRPGPLNSGMVDAFIKRKNGEIAIEVQHPLMESILRETYGTIVYQEQVMQIAQKMAQYTLGGADNLRKAMGKKDADLMQKQTDQFVNGAVANGIDKEVAITVFDLIKEFAEYGFNKSHSVAYAVISYQSAWLKIHHTGAFYAALLSGDMDNHERVMELYRSAIKMNLVFEQVNVNTSKYQFCLRDKKTVIWALGVLKGIGKPIAELIEQGRVNGEYRDFFDFCIRAQAHQIGQRCMEILIYAGAIDCFKQSRVDLLANIKQGLQLSKSQMNDQAIGQGDLFVQQHQQSLAPNFMQAEEYVSRFELLDKERKYSGIYVQQSPYGLLLSQLKALGVCSIRQLQAQFQRKSEQKGRRKTMMVKLFGAVEKFRLVSHSKSRHTSKYFELRVGDGMSSIECVLDDQDLVNQYQQAKLFIQGCLLILYGEAGFDAYKQAVTLQVTRIETVQTFRTHCLKRLKIRLPLTKLSDLHKILELTQNNSQLLELEEAQEVEAKFEVVTEGGWISYDSEIQVLVGNELVSLLHDYKDIEVVWNY